MNADFWRKLWTILRPYRKTFVGLTFFVAFFELFKLLPPYLLKLVVDNLTELGGQDLLKLIILALLSFGTNFVEIGLWRHYDWLVFKLLIDVETILPKTLHDKLVELSLSYHEKSNTGGTVAKVGRGVDKLVRLLGDFGWEFAPTVLQVLVTTVVVAIIEWRLAVVFIVAVPIFLFLTRQMNVRLYPCRQQRHQYYEDSATAMAQSIINIYTVKSFAQEAREAQEFNKIQDNIADISNKEFRSLTNYNWLRGLVIDLGRLSILLFAIYLVWLNQITIGSLIFFITLSEKAYLSLFRLSRIYDHIVESSTAVERIFHILEAKSDIVSKKSAQRIKLTGQISFNDVNFSYDSTAKPALTNVSFEILPGQKVALVGPSGGGKSTIVKLIYRHYDVNSGGITVDGHDLRDLDLLVYRRQLAIVPQEVEIFNTTIGQNIAYGLPQASLAQIKRAAKIARVDDFVQDLADGYETVVGERGVRLSGGQRQRVGIARALLIDPKILIFDEATSHLDTRSERLIQQALEEIAKERTTIIIAHRLSTIQSSDKILVIENGYLKEQGDHHSLQKNGGLYAELIRLQDLGEIVRE